MVRAVSVLLVVPFAALLVGDRLEHGAVAGVGLIALSPATLAYRMGWRQRGIGTRWPLVRGNIAVAVPAAVAAIVSYLALLWVWTQAPVAPASALRDTSAVFAIAIAAF